MPTVAAFVLGGRGAPCDACGDGRDAEPWSEVPDEAGWCPLPRPQPAAAKATAATATQPAVAAIKFRDRR